LREWISQSNIDAMRSQFRAKHINDSMFIEDLSKMRTVTSIWCNIITHRNQW